MKKKISMKINFFSFSHFFFSLVQNHYRFIVDEIGEKKNFSLSMFEFFSFLSFRLTDLIWIQEEEEEEGRKK